jgi:hypothetical protein
MHLQQRVIISIGTNGDQKCPQSILSFFSAPTEKSWPNYEKLKYAKKFDIKSTNTTGSKLKSTFAGRLTETGLDLLSQFFLYDLEKRIFADDALHHTYFRYAISFVFQNNRNRESPSPQHPTFFPPRQKQKYVINVL